MSKKPSMFVFLNYEFVSLMVKVASLPFIVSGSIDHEPTHDFWRQHRPWTSKWSPASEHAMDLRWQYEDMPWASRAALCCSRNMVQICPSWQHRPGHQLGFKWQHRPLISMWPPDRSITPGHQHGLSYSTVYEHLHGLLW